MVVLDDVRPDLAPALRASILLRESRLPARGSLNRRGWKSDEILTWPDPPVIELRAELARIVRWETASAWAMVNRRGSEHPRHYHHGAVVSAVYYVDPGDEENSSPTVFELPAAGTLREVHVAPAVGRLVIFPGSMWHRVPPYGSEEPRVTVALDVRG